jgi:hypothetical protein
MPNGCFEIKLEVYYEFTQTSPAQKKTWHEPGHGPEFQIDSIDLEGYKVLPEIQATIISNFIEERVDEHICQNYEDLMEQNAPDPDETRDNARMEDD